MNEERLPSVIKLHIFRMLASQPLLLRSAACCAARRVPVTRAATVAMIDLPALAFLTSNRPVVIWLGILACATAAKNLSKQANKNKLPSRRLNDSGECPFPFIFFHDPVDGLRKHPRKTLLLAILGALYNRAVIVSWLLSRLAPATPL